MQLVFEQLFGGESESEALVDLIDYNPGENDRQYIDMVVAGVKEHAADLDAEISACLRGWTIARLSRVDLAILRLAVYEMKYASLPAAVSINAVVRKYNGAWSSASANPFPVIIIRRYTSSSGSMKCTSQVATTGFLNCSPNFTILRLRFRKSSSVVISSLSSSRIINALFPSG